MDRPKLTLPPKPKDFGRRLLWPWVLGAGCLLVILIGLLLPHPAPGPADGLVTENALPQPVTVAGSALRSLGQPKHFSTPAPSPDAQQVVAEKVSRFAQNRLGVVHAMAEHFKVAVPPEVVQFYAAVAAGRWEEVKNRFATLKALREGTNNAVELARLWPAINETYGVAQIAHDWPPQKLLDYGEAVLGSLRPGMVYVGGTDAGRFIPTLLNETGDGERHVILTQNALADNSYTDYVRFLYEDRMPLLTTEDSQRAFKDYVTGAQARLAHDQQFPDEPKQIRPGEDVRVSDNRVQVGGQVAVMAINEQLLQMIMDKNPGATFALEESFPFKSTYAKAVPMGPIMELGLQDPQKSFTTDMAAQTTDYWRSATQALLADPDVQAGSDALQAYSKMATAQARLLEDHSFKAEAEETYRLATQLCPTSSEAVFSYVGLLANQKRFADALSVTEGAVKAAPDNEQFRGLVKALRQAAGQK